MPVTVSIVEDDAQSRAIFAEWISESSDFRLLSQHGSTEAALEKVPELKPDIVLTDINLPGLNGVEGVKKLKPLLPQTQFVMLTVYEDVDHIFEALSSGATGYLLKQTPRQELMNALQDVYNGGSPMSSKIARKVVQVFQKSNPKPEREEVPTELSPRENELVELLARGHLYKEIADSMGITVGTVNTYIRRIYEKLQVHSRTQAVAKITQKSKAFRRFAAD